MYSPLCSEGCYYLKEKTLHSSTFCLKKLYRVSSHFKHPCDILWVQAQRHNWQKSTVAPCTGPAPAQIYFPRLLRGLRHQQPCSTIWHEMAVQQMCAHSKSVCSLKASSTGCICVYFHQLHGHQLPAFQSFLTSLHLYVHSNLLFLLYFLSFMNIWNMVPRNILHLI